MHFCDCNHEITRMQQGKCNNIKDHKLISCWWKIWIHQKISGFAV